MGCNASKRRRRRICMQNIVIHEGISEMSPNLIVLYPCIEWILQYTIHKAIYPAFTKIEFYQILVVNPLNAELNPICCLLALLGAHHFLHVSRIRVKSLTLRLLMSYIYGAPILEVSRSHTTTQHSR